VSSDVLRGASSQSTHVSLPNDVLDAGDLLITSIAVEVLCLTWCRRVSAVSVSLRQTEDSPA
jgi:hypothetical protein